MSDELFGVSCNSVALPCQSGFISRNRSNALIRSGMPFEQSSRSQTLSTSRLPLRLSRTSASIAERPALRARRMYAFVSMLTGKAPSRTAWPSIL